MNYRLRHIISGKEYIVSSEYEQNAIDTLAVQLGVKSSEICVVRKVVSLNLTTPKDTDKK